MKIPTQIDQSLNYYATPFDPELRTCPACDGMGEITFVVIAGESDQDICTDCEGSGYVSPSEPDDGSEEGV